MIRLAALRDRTQLRSVQSDARLARWLVEHPQDVTALQLRQLSTSLHGFTIDIGLLERSRRDVDTLMRLDPTDPRPLSDYVDDRRVTLGNALLAGIEGLGRLDIGHVPTFLRLQDRWRSDPAVLLGLVDEADLVRTDALRLALDVDPGSVGPRLQMVRLDARLMTYLVTPVVVGGNTDATIRQTIADVAQRGVAAAAELSAAGSGATPRERAEALKLSAEIRRAWWYPLLTTEPDAARTTIFAAIDELEEAKTILLAEPDPAGDTFLEAVVFATRGLTYRMAAASVRQDETDEIDRLTALAIKVEQEAADFQARHPQELEPAPVVLGACAEISWRADAALALGEGRYDDAIAAWQRYIETFGDDPGALIDLGWNQYLAGDVAAARDTTARVETLAPDEPVAAANSALIEAASGRPEEALSAVDRLVEDLESLTPASQMASATSFIRDLGDLAGARAETREVVRSMSTRLSGWIVAHSPLLSTATRPSGSCSRTVSSGRAWRSAIRRPPMSGVIGDWPSVKGSRHSWRTARWSTP